MLTLHRACILASAFSTCSAQLLFPPLSHELAEELSVPHSDVDLGAAPHHEESPSRAGFSHPTLCDSSVQQTSGYVEVGGGDKYFFWLFESQSKPSSDPLVMWLSGGPGCSSQMALLFENGPCSVDPDGSSTTPNPWSWHKRASVMWVDQTSPVGFSTGRGVNTEGGVAARMVNFMKGFLQRMPMYQKTPFYLFGESYGGHYVPVIAHAIWRSNQAQEDGIVIPLRGVGIGNGLTDPFNQFQSYSEMGRDGGRSAGGHGPAGILSKSVLAHMDAELPRCLRLIESCNKGANPVTGVSRNRLQCIWAYEKCNNMAMGAFMQTGLNMYNVRQKCAVPGLCYDFKPIEKFLNAAEVQAELGVIPQHWQTCDFDVNRAFSHDFFMGYQSLVPDLLRAGIEVLVYAGDLDYIVNWLGVKQWTLALDWDHKVDFNQEADKDWVLDGQTVARLRSTSGFHFMQVFNAGHMVPTDQPAVALEMLNTFIHGGIQNRSATPVEEDILV